MPEVLRMRCTGASASEGACASKGSGEGAGDTEGGGEGGAIGVCGATRGTPIEVTSSRNL
jgi:hypothetical protein